MDTTHTGTKLGMPLLQGHTVRVNCTFPEHSCRCPELPWRSWLRGKLPRSWALVGCILSYWVSILCSLLSPAFMPPWPPDWSRFCWFAVSWTLILQVQNILVLPPFHFLLFNMKLGKPKIVCVRGVSSAMLSVDLIRFLSYSVYRRHLSHNNWQSGRQPWQWVVTNHDLYCRDNWKQGLSSTST